MRFGFTMIGTFIALLLAFACNKANPDPVSEEEVPPRLILKSELDPELQGKTIVGISPVKGGYRINFTGGSTFLFDTNNYALCGCNQDDKLSINGEATIYDYVASPYYTIGADGLWYKDGVKTYRRATPENDFAKEGDIYFTNVQEKPSEFVFCFSDGSYTAVARNVVHKMYVRKSDSRMDVFIGRDGDEDYIMYPFKKRYKGYVQGAYPSFLDNWGIMALELYKKEDNSFSQQCALFLNGEAEMAVNVPRSDDASTYVYVGGTLHGFENITEVAGIRQLTIKVDGQEYAETSSFDLMEAKEIEMTQRSIICQSYSNGNPFGEVFRKWTFKDGRLSIHIELKLLRDIQFRQGMFGMLCVLRHWKENVSEDYLTCWAIKDNKNFTPYDITDGWTSRGASTALVQRDPETYRITEYGRKGFSFALVVDKDTRKNGGMHCGTNGNGYNKIYFDMTGNYSAKKDEVLTADVHWDIEKTRTQK